MSTIDPVEKKRVRWRSRRGLLELDLVLEKFLAQRYDQLTPEEFEAYVELLDLPDTDFLDVVDGKAEVTNPKLEHMVEVLRSI